MIHRLHKTFFLAFAGAVAFSWGCTKPSNNSSNNGGGGNNNPTNPSIKVVQPIADTLGAVGVPMGVVVSATAGTNGAVLDSVVRTDGGATAPRKFTWSNKNLKDTVMHDLYFVPSALDKGPITLTYILYDSKGNTSTATRKVSSAAAVKVFAVYSGVVVYDQTQSGQYPMLNTGLDPTKNLPYSEGDVNSDTSKRRLVDLCCATTKGQAEILFCPAYESLNSSFADSDIFNIHSLWTLSQRNTTHFKLLSPVPSSVVSPSNYPNEAAAEAAYNNAFSKVTLAVQSIFSPSDSYAFQTQDGRYGAFTVTQFGGGIKMNMALQER